MNLKELLMSMGINISSSMIWDFIKASISKRKTKKEIIEDLSNYLSIEGANIKAEQIINFLVDSGKLYIENSQIYSNEGIEYNTTYTSDNLTIKNSVSRTDNTEISVNGNATIKMAGNAKIIQNDNGIIFSVSSKK